MTEQPIELLPCPFCGDDDILPCYDEETREWQCGCDNCSIHATGFSEKYVIGKWNTRTLSLADLRVVKETLAIAKSLTKKYTALIDFKACDERQITELREIHYQSEEAIALIDKLLAGWEV